MTAEERISNLLKRVGYNPIRFKNVEEKADVRRTNLEAMINEKYNGDYIKCIIDSSEIINDLECALENMANRYNL